MDRKNVREIDVLDHLHNQGLEKTIYETAADVKNIMLRIDRIEQRQDQVEREKANISYVDHIKEEVDALKESISETILATLKPTRQEVKKNTEFREWASKYSNRIIGGVLVVVFILTTLVDIAKDWIKDTF